MKNCMPVILILLLLIGYSVARGQDYIVLTKGDTLFGRVVTLNQGVQTKIQHTDGNKNKTYYSMLEVKSFSINDEIHHLVRMLDQYKYMKLVTPGYLSFYYYQTDKRPVWDGQYLYKKDGAGLDVSIIGFKKRLSEFIKECPELSEEVSEGRLGRNDMDEIIRRYNECIDERTRNTEAIVSTEEVNSKPVAPAWQSLAQAVQASTDLQDKQDIADMIADVRNKLKRGEKIPNFLIEALKKSLEGKIELTELLTKALAEREY